MPLGVISIINGFFWLVKRNLIAFILSFLEGLFLLWFGKMEYAFEARKYCITPEGLFVGRRKKAFYTWEQIYEIGIYPYGAAASLQVFDKVICCSFVPPSANFKRDLFHNPRFYGERNLEKFVIIDYDKETIKAFSNVYPKEIIDYTKGMKGCIRNDKFRENTEDVDV